MNLLFWTDKSPSGSLRCINSVVAGILVSTEMVTNFLLDLEMDMRTVGLIKNDGHEHYTGSILNFEKTLHNQRVRICGAFSMENPKIVTRNYNLSLSHVNIFCSFNFGDESIFMDSNERYQYMMHRNKALLIYNLHISAHFLTQFLR